MSHSSQVISEAIEPLRQQLITHPLYRRMQTLDDLRVFMEHHGYAVFDFMSLLKTLQQRLTCVSVPWVPQGDPQVRLLINQIVLGEESDRAADGRVCSHYELYLEAMHEAGADSGPLSEFVRLLSERRGVDAALIMVDAPLCVRRFVNHTFRVIHEGGIHAVAATFTYGREDLIPGVFSELVNSLHAQESSSVGMLRHYLDRHIQLDGDEHGEFGREMVVRLCGNDAQRWAEAHSAALAALEERLALWDGIDCAVQERREKRAKS